MKIDEIRNMTDEELRTKSADFRTEMMNMRFQSTVARLDNPLRIRSIRRDVARIETLLRERAAEAGRKARS